MTGSDQVTYTQYKKKQENLKTLLKASTKMNWKQSTHYGFKKARDRFVSTATATGTEVTKTATVLTQTEVVPMLNVDTVTSWVISRRTAVKGRQPMHPWSTKTENPFQGLTPYRRNLRSQQSLRDSWL